LARQLLEYFEVARTEMLRKTGLSYKSLEDTGYYLPLIESHTNIKHRVNMMRSWKYIEMRKFHLPR
jgi:acyl-CoA thioesterase FadM